jgi:hypothetical protein
MTIRRRLIPAALLALSALSAAGSILTGPAIQAAAPAVSAAGQPASPDMFVHG